MSQWLAERTSALLAARVSRRSFLVRSAVVGSALAVGPVAYVLRPGTAYAFVCQCGDAGCSCGSACCDGYTNFCCTLYGTNSCPPGTFAGGWWQADGSTYCAGARYYIDCMGECTTCTNGCGGGSSFCEPACATSPVAAVWEAAPSARPAVSHSVTANAIRRSPAQDGSPAGW